MNIPNNLKYTKTDEWFDPATGKAGLTDYAQSQLSDIVFVEIMVNPGETLEAGQQVASIESVKAAAESYAAVNGKVTAINDALSGSPEILNSDPYGGGWLLQIEGGDADGLMDASSYEKYCAERSEAGPAAPTSSETPEVLFVIFRDRDLPGDWKKFADEVIRSLFPEYSGKGLRIGIRFEVDKKMPAQIDGAKPESYPYGTMRLPQLTEQVGMGALELGIKHNLAWSNFDDKLGGRGIVYVVSPWK